MRIEAEKMKSCFTCRLANVFLFPNKALFDYKDIKVECASYPVEDKLLAIGAGCPDYNPCCNHKTILKES